MGVPSPAELLPQIFRFKELQPVSIVSFCQMDPAPPIPPPSALAPSPSLRSVQAGDLAAASSLTRVGYFRWVICALLLFGVTKNYMDRQLLGVLKTTLQHDFGWNDIQYGHLVSYFQI